MRRPRHIPRRQSGTAGPSVSSVTGSGVFVGVLPVRNSRPSLDPYAARRRFPALWAEFLRGAFPSHLHVAVAFGVCEKTARLWWEGTTGPQGWAVNYAREAIPGADEALREAA